MEIEGFTQEFDLDEEERCSKMIRTTQEMSVSTSVAQLEIFVEKIGVLLDKSSDSTDLQLAEMATKPPVYTEYQQIYDALGKEFADQVNLLKSKESIY